MLRMAHGSSGRNGYSTNRDLTNDRPAVRMAHSSSGRNGYSTDRDIGMELMLHPSSGRAGHEIIPPRPQQQQQPQSYAAPPAKVLATYPPRSDAKGHKLTPDTRIGESTDWVCELCQKLYSNGTLSFRCKPCDFDLCLECHDAVPCPKNHAMAPRRKPGTGYQCNRCDREVDRAMGCEICDFDLCVQCLMRSSHLPLSAPEGGQSIIASAVASKPSVKATRGPDGSREHPFKLLNDPITCAVGDYITFSETENPSTGYTWNFFTEPEGEDDSQVVTGRKETDVFPSNLEVIASGCAYPESARGMCGASGRSAPGQGSQPQRATGNAALWILPVLGGSTVLPPR